MPVFVDYSDSGPAAHMSLEDVSVAQHTALMDAIINGSGSPADMHSLVPAVPTRICAQAKTLYRRMVRFTEATVLDDNGISSTDMRNGLVAEFSTWVESGTATALLEAMAIVESSGSTWVLLKIAIIARLGP